MVFRSRVPSSRFVMLTLVVDACRLQFGCQLSNCGNCALSKMRFTSISLSHAIRLPHRVLFFYEVPPRVPTPRKTNLRALPSG